MWKIREWLENQKQNLDFSYGEQKKIYILMILAVIVAGGFFLISKQVFASPIPIAQATNSDNTYSDKAIDTHAIAINTETSTFYIDVAGKVRHPGVYKLEKGMRVNDALKAAGGSLPGVDLTYLNLADSLSDGEEIIVGNTPQIISGNSPDSTDNSSTSIPSKSTSKSKSSKATSSFGKKKTLPTTPINLNNSTLTQLEQLLGVGPAMAQKILDYRKSLGKFTNINQLQNISGMGASHFAKVKPYVRTS